MILRKWNIISYVTSEIRNKISIPISVISSLLRPANEVCGNVMFLHLSVCPQGEGCYDATSCYGQNPPLNSTNSPLDSIHPWTVCTPWTARTAPLDSTHPQTAPPGQHPPPDSTHLLDSTHSPGQHPPPGKHPPTPWAAITHPLDSTHSPGQHPPPSNSSPGQQVGSTHLTGILFCLHMFLHCVSNAQDFIANIDMVTIQQMSLQAWLSRLNKMMGATRNI